jgi:hypothetical protein
MKIRVRYVFPVMLALAGCAGSSVDAYSSSDVTTAPGAAPPQRVEAVSDALGARMNNMLASPGYGGSVTR